MTTYQNNSLINTLNESLQPFVSIFSKANMNGNHFVAIFAIYCIHDILNNSIKEKSPIKTHFDLKKGEFDINVN